MFRCVRYVVGALVLWVAPFSLVAAAPAVAEFKIVVAPAWVDRVSYDKDGQVAADKQTAGMSYLLLDRQVYVRGSDKQSYNHIALRVDNASGLERAAQVSIEFDPSYHALQLHYVNVIRGDKTMARLNAKSVQVLQREKSLEYQIYDGTKTANMVLEDVRVGDVVEYAYTRRGSNPVFGGKHYGQMDLQWTFPVQKAFGRIVTEPGRDPAVMPVNLKQPMQVRMVGGMQSFEWTLSDVPGIRYRDDAPGWYDPYASVQWSDFKTWPAVVQWALPLYKTPAKLSAEMQEEVSRIKATTSKPAERAAEALRYVQKNVRYLGVEVGPGSHAPTAPDVVLARRFGDCKDKTLLTVTLLRALGIEAAPALVHSKVKKGIRDYLPMPGAFDHVIVLAKVDGQTYWLDPTRAPQMGMLDSISQPDFGYALVLEQGQAELTAMEPGSAAMYTRRVVSLFDVRGSLKDPVPFTVTSTFDGVSAEQIRNSLTKESREDYQKHLLNYFSRFYPDIVVDRPYEVLDNTNTNQVVLIEHYLLSDFWKKTKDGQMEGYVASPDVNDYLRAPQTTVRTEPLATYHPMEVMQTTLVQVSPKWKLKGDTTEVKDPAFTFASTATVKPGLLTMVDTYRTLADAVEAQALPAYLANAKKARNQLGYSLYRSEKDDE